jgi:urease gamma subunit
VRLFVVNPESGSWDEVTSGAESAGDVVRLAASDLQRARRQRASIRAEHPDVAVILDLEVAIAPDFRSVADALPTDDDTVRYAGTVDGLTGLVADIERADVADGVTLIPVWPSQQPETLGPEILRRLELRRLSA